MAGYPAIEPAPKRAPDRSVSLRTLLIGGIVLVVFGVLMWAITKRKPAPAADTSADISGSGADNSGATFISTSPTPGPVGPPGPIGPPGPVGPPGPPITKPPIIAPGPSGGVNPPSQPKTYTVKAGDTLAKIARMFGLGALTLGQQNQATIFATAGQHGIAGGKSKWGNYDRRFDYIYQGEILNVPS